jgi:hypothetical protein
MSNDPHLKNTKQHISPRILTNNSIFSYDTVQVIKYYRGTIGQFNNNRDKVVVTVNKAHKHYYRITCFVDNDNNELASLTE